MGREAHYYPARGISVSSPYPIIIGISTAGGEREGHALYGQQKQSISVQVHQMD